jgi:voltage-gated potassium channel
MKSLDKQKLHDIIFETNTPKGKAFDIVLLIFIVLSVIIVALETVPSYGTKYGLLFKVLEWVFTIAFTIEYILRIYTVKKPIKYIKSFYGIVDLLSILPAYLSIIITGSQSLVVIRALRLLRVFRIFKMAQALDQGFVIVRALRNSSTKIGVFLFVVMITVCIFGSMMYLVEGGANDQFDSIPRSIYWSIVTLTTVGFGDITPQTTFGQFLSAALMILGYAIIAVPTGIVTSELFKDGDLHESDLSTEHCRSCSKEGHDPDAIYCKYCGDILNDPV